LHKTEKIIFFRTWS